MTYRFESIGLIHTPFREAAGMPIQPRYARGVAGTIEVFEPFREGLAGLDGFSHIHVLYAFHRSAGYDLTVTPYLDQAPHGLFATRAPRRVNPIGLSVVRLVRVEGAFLHVEDVDMLDGTPLLDIKPFNPTIDNRTGCRVGWMKGKTSGKAKVLSDDRFAK